MLSGAHTLGRSRPERSGWGKPETKYTVSMNPAIFTFLLDMHWRNLFNAHDICPCFTVKPANKTRGKRKPMKLRAL